MGLPMRAYFEFLNFTNWNAWAESNQMGVDMQVVLHVNVTMPDGTEENCLQMLFNEYHWNMTMIVDGLDFHAHLTTGYLPEVRLLSCNFCTEEYPLDMDLYKEIFNTVFLPETGATDLYLNTLLLTKKIPWPAEIMGVAQFSNIEISFGDGYMMFGSGMTWVPFPMPVAGLAKKVQPEPTMKDRKKNEKNQYTTKF